MSPLRIGGIVLLVVGVILLVIGISSSGSIVDKASYTWSGRFTERTTWYIVGGIAMGIAGALMAAFGGSGKRD
jgi:hypothetical protein